jgi:hypothetical protein
LIVFNTAVNTQQLNVLIDKVEATLLYRSVNTDKTDEIAPLSFTIYQLN